MGEIKSAIELAMERTMHLSMSKEEKREQAIREFREALNGLLLRVKIGTLTLDQFDKEWSSLGRDSDLPRKNILVEELAARIDPDEENEWAIELLGSFCTLEPEKFLRVLRGYREQLALAAAKRMEAIKGTLMRERRISGGAVRPNLDMDREWTSIRQKVRDEFDAALRQEVEAVTGPCLA